jgi:hypothetical protein
VKIMRQEVLHERDHPGWRKGVKAVPVNFSGE